MENKLSESSIEALAEGNKDSYLKKHLARYYHHKGKTVSDDDILPVSRIKPLMDEYAAAMVKKQGAKASSPQTSMRWVKASEELPPYAQVVNIKCSNDLNSTIMKGVGMFEGENNFVLRFLNASTMNQNDIELKYIEWLSESSSPQNTAIEEIECYVPVSVEDELPPLNPNLPFPQSDEYLLFTKSPETDNKWYSAGKYDFERKEWYQGDVHKETTSIVTHWLKKTTVKVLKETSISSPQNKNL